MECLIKYQTDGNLTRTCRRCVSCAEVY